MGNVNDTGEELEIEQSSAKSSQVEMRNPVNTAHDIAVNDGTRIRRISQADFHPEVRGWMVDSCLRTDRKTGGFTENQSAFAVNWPSATGSESHIAGKETSPDDRAQRKKKYSQLTKTRRLLRNADKAKLSRYQEIKNTRDTKGHEGTRW